MSASFRAFLVLTIALGLWATPAQAEKPVVFVTIAPQKAFAQKLAGNRFDIRVLVGSGADPHRYDPKPSQMRAMAKAKAYFAVGVEVEDAWLPRFTDLNPGLLVVHTDEGIAKLDMGEHGHHCDHGGHGEHEGHDHHKEHGHHGKHEGHGHHDDHHDDHGHHEHGHHEGHDHHDEVHHAEHGEHEEHGSHEGHAAHAGHDHHEHCHHDGNDPHIWLAPKLVAIQAGHMAKAFAQVDPANAAEYQANLKAFQRELRELHKELVDILKPVRGKEFFIFHPSWGYFANAYGLVQVPIEVEGKEPSPRELAELTRRARESNAKAIFVQPQFSRRSASTVAQAVGAKLVDADPLAENWAANLRQVARAMRELSH